MERMVNRVFIIGNLGERSGRVKGENSMKIIQNELQQHIHDIPIHFLSNPNRADVAERKQNDEFADNCIYVCENLNFQPEEFGYIEPVVEVKEPAEEVKQEPEKKEEEKSSPQKNSKDKSKKDDSKKLVESQQKTGDAEGEVVEEKVVEQPPEEEGPVEEPFTSATIHQYKRNLGSLGDIYINDAPLCTLSTSNSLIEVQCPKKVMGMKITEELR